MTTATAPAPCLLCQRAPHLPGCLWCEDCYEHLRADVEPVPFEPWRGWDSEARP